MFVLFNKTIFELDEIVNQYLIYLTHIQQSVTLKVSDKINAFNYAEQIANEINALTGKLLSMRVNSFNQDDIFRFIDKNFYPIIRNLQAQIAIYDKLLSINEKMYFSIKEAINFLVNDTNYGINFSIDKLNRLLSYQKLFLDEEEKSKAERHRLALEELKRKENQAFEEIKFKTFKDLLRGTKNSNEDYFYKTNSYVITNLLDEFTFDMLENPNKTGCFFGVEKHIHIVVNKDNLKIDYIIKIDTSNQISNITINGFIQHADSKVDFYIEEKFDKSLLNSYLNAFNLTPIIKKWNECYLQYFSQKESEMKQKDNAKKHIDDFFAGKII
jgi:hypothetical protein